MGNGQYKHGSQRHKSHPNIAALHRKASTSKLPSFSLGGYLCNPIDRAEPSHDRYISSISFVCFLSIPMTGTTSSLHDKYTATTTPRDGMSRTASGSDINERTYSMFFPIERLAKVRSVYHGSNRSFMNILFSFPNELCACRFCIRKHNKNAAPMALYRRYLWFVYRSCYYYIPVFGYFCLYKRTTTKKIVHRGCNLWTRIWRFDVFGFRSVAFWASFSCFLILFLNFSLFSYSTHTRRRYTLNFPEVCISTVSGPGQSCFCQNA